MKKIALVFVIQLMISSSLYSQDIKDGYIIDKETYVFGFDTTSNPIYRFTPTISEIKDAEKIIMSSKTFIRNQPNAKLGNDIFRNYKNYFKQYVGLVNQDGDRLILVNYIDKRYRINNSNKKEVIEVIDGGNSYWRALINIDTNEIVEISINGLG